jgi:dienelactone hydrolase
MRGAARRLADLDAAAVSTREVAIPTPRGPLRALSYRPAGRARRAALLVPGLHSSGIEEPRLVRLARHLSASEVAVVTPDIPELSKFDISPAITDGIESAALWLASQSGLTTDGRIALLGIGFSGGLSIVAAARPSIATHVAYVLSIGGHQDLPRVLRYLCTGSEPHPPGRIPLNAAARSDEPFVRTPHDHGVAVVLLGVADHIVPAAQVEPLREAVRRHLRASALDSGVDKAVAADEFAALRALAKTMPEPSATLLRYVNDRDVAHLGARLLPYVGFYARDAGLSVSRSPKPSAPVFLLHGTDDNVIPWVEAEYLAEDLRGHAPVRSLVSGLISHEEIDQPVRAGDVLQLAAFWGDVLGR